jgi:hypothetical protein
VTPKPTKAGADLLVGLLVAEINGQPSIPADDLNVRVVDKLFEQGLVAKRVELTDAGRAAAHAATHPDATEATPA